MNNTKKFYWSLVVALSGFLFGFDAVVISGVDKQLQQLWHSSDLFHGIVVMSMALWGTVIWVFISEIFPNKLRAAGQAFGCSVHWVLATLIPSFIPFLFKEIGTATVFAFFCLMMVFQLVWVWKKMPETKGQTLKNLSKNLAN